MTSIARFRRWVAGAAAAALAALIFAWSASGQTAADIVAEFKYGSVGTEETVGVPYWIWRVLPEVFPDKLPNRSGTGYARLGLVYERSEEHTSELQSQSNLVCRLLLEKKKTLDICPEPELCHAFSVHLAYLWFF